MTTRHDDFLGRGWAFPPTLRPAVGETLGVAMVEGEEDVRQSLAILLSTSVGERLLHPAFGCDLRRFVFEPLTLGMQTRIRDLVETAILYFEPRVVLEDVAIEASAAEGRLVIDVSYRLPATNTRSNLVLPYYLGEGAKRL